jgi:hypothetical protein
MEISKTRPIERIARVLAAQSISVNADGSEPSAAREIGANWADRRDDAIAVLRTLRVPDERMAAMGDLAVWERMIAAALGEEAPAPASGGLRDEPPALGNDPLHEGP